ncbi:nicotinamide riboside transporter PnuC [Shewanella sp. SR44-3]|uniref:nicotinamide riboside transporter PnuC n=1 Tax=unclassified Shewanella TaxID=196818 RepID=UPI0015FA1146|nr:nicotinamide riboside transporter PnuC [Shewanella sp. SR44-3]MBB1269431.1 nicotinamide mononucleotide transporter [Shewanella sp. SR44-3]
MMTYWELFAVILAVVYLLLAMKANIWCWLAAFVSTAIYTVLFWKVSLLMESVLNIYYMGMALYGYWLWQQDGHKLGPTNGASSSHIGPMVLSWSFQTHVKLIAVTALISVGVGYLMANYTQASFPYLDAATTCFAVMTTYLVAKKVLENWLYWIVIDLVSIYLYFQKGLMLTTGLFMAYVLMAAMGYLMWRKRLENQTQAATLATH